MAENGRRGWEDEERGPGALHHGFVLMEALVEKLKILNCDQELLEKHNMKPLSRHVKPQQHSAFYYICVEMQMK